VTPLADLARAMFAAGVAAVRPDSLLRRVEFSADGCGFAGEPFCPPARLILVAIGKAAPGLAAAFLRRSRRRPDRVFVLAPHGAAAADEVAPSTRFASHPHPAEDGAAATRELFALLTQLTVDDGVVLLLSGGGSALLAEPLPGVSLAELVRVTDALLAAGAPIAQLNTVRKHLLAAGGGRLALACPAPLLTLAISDVPGDDLTNIASGPAVGDPSTCADALAVLARRGLVAAFPHLVSWLAAGSRQEIGETPKPGDPRLAHARCHVLGSNRDALRAAAETAEQAGFRVARLGHALRGEARAVGETIAALVRALASGEPAALLAAGETTVTVRGEGRGGRNLELALGAAVGLAGVPERCVLAAATDGVDGSSPAAGAVVDGSTIARGLARGRDALAALGRNDAWGFFDGLPEAIVTGPTGTNVADLVFMLAAGSPPGFHPAERFASRQLPVLPGRASATGKPHGA
jgi:glycerate 2-kinase